METSQLTKSLSASEPEPVFEAVELVPATDGFLRTRSDGVGGFGPIKAGAPVYTQKGYTYIYLYNYNCYYAQILVNTLGKFVVTLIDNDLSVAGDEAAGDPEPTLFLGDDNELNEGPASTKNIQLLIIYHLKFFVFNLFNN